MEPERSYRYRLDGSLATRRRVSSYETLRTLAAWTMCLLAAWIAVLGFGVLATAGRSVALQGMTSGNTPPSADLASAAYRYFLFLGFSGLLLLATGVVFIRWFHRAYRNLTAFDATGRRFGTGWAVGGWFVPILNLWRPKQIADELWRRSDPEALRQARRPGDAMLPVHLWWGLVLVWLLGPTGTGGAGRADLWLEVMNWATGMLAAVAAIFYVYVVTTRQEGHAARLSGRGEAGASGPGRVRPVIVAAVTVCLLALVVSGTRPEALSAATIAEFGTTDGNPWLSTPDDLPEWLKPPEWLEP